MTNEENIKDIHDLSVLLKVRLSEIHNKTHAHFRK